MFWETNENQNNNNFLNNNNNVNIEPRQKSGKKIMKNSSSKINKKNMNSNNNNKNSNTNINVNKIYQTNNYQKEESQNNSSYNQIIKNNFTKINKQENENDENSMYDIVFLPKYHSPIANKARLINQETTSDGNIIKEYQNKKEIIFPNIGLRKEIFEDGYQISYFKNKDIKQLYPDGKEVYLYAENHTVATKFPNGLKVCKFANGQIEKVFQMGPKM